MCLYLCLSLSFCQSLPVAVCPRSISACPCSISAPLSMSVSVYYLCLSLSVTFCARLSLPVSVYSYLIEKSFRYLKKDFTSAVCPLIVLILTLTSSLLTYSVSVYIVYKLYRFYCVGYVEISSFTIKLPFDVKIFPQRYTLNCVKTGDFHGYNFSLYFGTTKVTSATNCESISGPPGQCITGS